MKNSVSLPIWTIAAPLAAVLVLALSGVLGGWGYELAAAVALGAAIMAGVHHAEVVAHKVGEPLGTLVLAVAVTVIEVALIVSLMLGGGESTTALARDTVFAAVMIILNGIVGACLLIGGNKHGEQNFGLYGVNSAMITLATITVLTLVLPNYTTSAPGPVYTPSQLAFIAVICLVLYFLFLLVQTVRHRDYFLPAHANQHPGEHVAPPSNPATALSAGLLLICLVGVILLSKKITPALEALVTAAGAPKSVVGIIIAAVVLMPEGVAALRAAYSNRLQTSLNLALGSALASVGLTVPVVAAVSLYMGWPLTLGLDIKSIVLLVLSLIVVTMSLGTGRTTLLPGAVHLVIFAAYLFVSVVP
jgi:Ca2+:H+ antiporter